MHITNSNLCLLLIVRDEFFSSPLRSLSHATYIDFLFQVIYYIIIIYINNVKYIYYMMGNIPSVARLFFAI